MSAPASAAQWERTRFAWRRTGLTDTVVALLATRQALLADPVWLRALGAAIVILVWLVGLVAAHRRVVAISRGVTASGWAPLSATATTVGFAAVGVLLLGGGDPF